MTMISEEQKEFYKSSIRKELIINPSISAITLAEKLNINRNTANKYLKIVAKEQTQQMEKEIEKLKTESVEEAMSQMQEKTRTVVEELWLVIQSTDSDRARVSACKAILNAYKDIFDLKFDAGLFAKKLGELEVPSMAKLAKIVKDAKSDRKTD